MGVELCGSGETAREMDMRMGARGCGETCFVVGSFGGWGAGDTRAMEIVSFRPSRSMVTVWSLELMTRYGPGALGSSFSVVSSGFVLSREGRSPWERSYSMKDAVTHTALSKSAL